MRPLGALGLAAAAVGAGAMYCARRLGRQSGEGYVSALRRLPREARSLADDVGRRARLALDEGLQAARMREEQVARELTSAESGKTAT